MPVINNKKGSKATIRLTSSATVTLADLAKDGETISGAIITGVCWSTNGAIVVARGANTILSLAGSGQWNLNEGGGALAEDKAADFAVTITGAGTLLLGVAKSSSVNGLEQP